MPKWWFKSAAGNTDAKHRTFWVERATVYSASLPAGLGGGRVWLTVQSHRHDQPPALVNEKGKFGEKGTCWEVGILSFPKKKVPKNSGLGVPGQHLLVCFQASWARKKEKRERIFSKSDSKWLDNSWRHSYRTLKIVGGGLGCLFVVRNLDCLLKMAINWPAGAFHYCQGAKGVLYKTVHSGLSFGRVQNTPWW